MAIFYDTIVLGEAKGKAKPKAPQGPPRDPLQGGGGFPPQGGKLGDF